jgi:hypothetical protein
MFTGRIVFFLFQTTRCFSIAFVSGKPRTAWCSAMVFVPPFVLTLRIEPRKKQSWPSLTHRRLCYRRAECARDAPTATIDKSPAYRGCPCVERKESKLALVEIGGNTGDWNRVRIKLVTRIYGIARRGSVLAIKKDETETLNRDSPLRGFNGTPAGNALRNKRNSKHVQP